MRALVCAVLFLAPCVASAQDLELAIGAEPTTTGGLSSEVVLEQLVPALPRIAECYRSRPATLAPLRLRFDAAGVPTVMSQPGAPADCLHTAVAGVRVGPAPDGARRMALVRLVVFGRPVVPPAPAPPPREESDVDVGLILGLALGGGALVGGAMMLGSTQLVEEDRGFLFWPGLVLAAPGLAIGAVALLIHLALED